MYLSVTAKNSELIFFQKTHSGRSPMKLYTAQWGDRCYFSSASQQSADVANLPKNIKRDIIESFIPDMYQYLLSYTGCWLAGSGVTALGQSGSTYDDCALALWRRTNGLWLVDYGNEMTNSTLLQIFTTNRREERVQWGGKSPSTCIIAIDSEND